MAQIIENEAIVAARAALESSRHYVLRHIQVEQMDDAILLSGRLESYYLKQQAQELLRDVSHGLQVVNAIEVAASHFDVDD